MACAPYVGQYNLYTKRKEIAASYLVFVLSCQHLLCLIIGSFDCLHVLWWNFVVGHYRWLLGFGFVLQHSNPSSLLFCLELIVNQRNTQAVGLWVLKYLGL